jgi:uncharacterized protein YegL
MPALITDPSMQSHAAAGSSYGYSGKRIGDLGSSEYTLVVLAMDVSGSVYRSGPAIEVAIKNIVQACRHSPRADNLMLRVVLFDHTIQELHGFKPLTECNVDDYTGTINPGGGTALYDASHNAIEAASRYGRDLVAQRYDANAIVFVGTDGKENGNSSLTVSEVAKALNDSVTDEALESMRAVLLGINVDPTSGTSQWLDTFRTDAGFDQYVAIGDATEDKLAKLADFVSRSISSQSQALGTGGPSQSLTF